MAEEQGRRKPQLLVYPKHVFNPEDLLTFVEMNGFADDWAELGLTDEDLAIFQAMIMAAPKGAPAIPDTRGFRVLELKRANRPLLQIRVGYVYFEEYAVVLLVMARTDDAMTNLSQKGRDSIRRLIEREEQAFATKYVK